LWIIYRKAGRLQITAESTDSGNHRRLSETNNGAKGQMQIRDSFLYMLPLIFNNLIPFLTLPIFTRILTTQDYGVLSLAQVYAVFVSGIANLGMTISYERNYFQYQGNKRDSAALIFSSLAFVIINIFILGIFTYCFRERLAGWIIGSPKWGGVLFWAFINNCVMILVVFYQLSLRNAQKVFSYVGYTAAISLLNVVFSLFLVAFLKIGVIGLVYAQLVANLAVFIILTFSFISRLSLSFSWPIFLDSFKISYPLTPRIFLGAVNQQFDKYIIGLMSTLGGVGIYRIGQQIASLVFSYMTQLEHVFTPQTYQKMFGGKDRVDEEIGRYLTPFLFASIVIALIVCLFSEEIIYVLTPPAFHDAIDIVTILSMFYGFLFFGKITGIQLIYMKKTYITSLLSFSTLALNIIINIPFIMKWGAIGAAWGTMISGIISCSISFNIAQRFYRIRWEYKKISSIFFIFFGSAIAMILLRYFDISYWVRLAIKLTSLAGYAYLGIKLNILTRENYLLAKNIFSINRGGSY